ncbi:hypothetical protein [Mesobacterium pallidum]|uniref:hypothetical protein n=1 Tax=Mesobacterium pallidum TaxID=2872037 RepID=UPI001EE2DA13|nr:hypothetical protein [Mesobacterium pallidum]
MTRLMLLLAGLVLAACTTGNDLDKAPPPLGNFLMGHLAVVAAAPVVGPASREVEPDQWVTAMTDAMNARFGPHRHDGTHYYHLGISVDGYVLAQPGIPLIYSPKSILIVNLTVWDDAKGTKLTEKPEQLTVIEAIEGDTLLGSGYTRSAEEQMLALSKSMAKTIETYLQRKNREEKWFGGPEATPPRAAPVAAAADIPATEAQPAATE